MRRFPRSLHNLLNEFSRAVDHCLCFMNDAKAPILVFEQEYAVVWDGQKQKIVLSGKDAPGK